MRKRNVIAFFIFIVCTSMLGGCTSHVQTDDLTYDIPEYEKITYTTEPVVRGNIAPMLELRLKADTFERKEYYPDHDEMKVDKVFVKVGDTVREGDTLVTFVSDDLEEERRQYVSRVEEDALLIDHYTKLGEINQTDEYQESIEGLKKDQQLANLYIKDLDVRMAAYTIKADANGIVSSLSDMLSYGTVYAMDAVVTILCGSDYYTAKTDDDYDFKVGDTFTGTFGVAEYPVVLTGIEELATSTDAEVSRRLTFELADKTSRPSTDSMQVVIKKQELIDVLYVPKEAVFHSNGKDYVYLLDENGFRHGVSVTVGSTVDDYTVIEDGLKEGDKVVVTK